MDFDVERLNYFLNLVMNVISDFVNDLLFIPQPSDLLPTCASSFFKGACMYQSPKPFFYVTYFFYRRQLQDITTKKWSKARAGDSQAQEDCYGLGNCDSVVKLPHRFTRQLTTFTSI